MLYLLLLLGGVFFIQPVLAEATSYYVAKGGSDSVSCTQARSLATPKFTISSGISCLSGGDTLEIRAGTYEEYIDAYSNPQGKIPSGSAGAETVVQAYQNEVVTIRPRTGGLAGDAVWFNSDQNYIVLSGLIIDAKNVGYNAIRFSERVHHIRIVNSEVKNAFSYNCIGVTGTDAYDVHHLTFSVVKVHGCGNANDGLLHGIYLRGPDHVVEYSEIYDVLGGYGIHIFGNVNGTSNRNIIRNNRIYNTGRRGILLGNGADNAAYNNFVWATGQHGIEIYGGAPTNNQIYNNTIFRANGYCIHVASSSMNAIVKNNICWENNNNSVLNEGTGTSISHNLLTADPKLANPASFDFRIREGSPAIDSGATIQIVEKDFFGAMRPSGGSYDIGAHEWSSGDFEPPKVPTGLRFN